MIRLDPVNGIHNKELKRLTDQAIEEETRKGTNLTSEQAKQIDYVDDIVTLAKNCYRIFLDSLDASDVDMSQHHLTILLGFFLEAKPSIFEYNPLRVACPCIRISSWWISV